MANILPFKGIKYNQNIIGDISKVATPPYDVISKEEQEKFLNRNPNNIIRLILGSAKDKNPGEFHTNAAEYFSKWCAEDILVQDALPALYQTTIEYSVNNKKMIRSGIIALAKLESFDKGVILPHEQTFSKIKSERLDLLKKCHANFSSIFSIYSDPENLIQQKIKESVGDSLPDIDFVDDSGHRQKLWSVTDPLVHGYVSAAMKKKTVFIADGHHRYETALNYRDLVAKNNPSFDSDHPANFIMMYLCGMEDPGLSILPAHRILTGIDSSTLNGLIEKCREFFDVTSIPVADNSIDKGVDKLVSALRENAACNIIGVCVKDIEKIYLMKLKPGVMDKKYENELSVAIRNLDVTVLSRLIFKDILDFNQSMLDDENLFSYTTDESEAVKKVLSGRSDIAFILNSTKVDQVRRIAKEGEVMPRKSTYFYPKVITGQVMNDLKSV